MVVEDCLYARLGAEDLKEQNQIVGVGHLLGSRGKLTGLLHIASSHESLSHVHKELCLCRGVDLIAE